MFLKLSILVLIVLIFISIVLTELNLQVCFFERARSYFWRSFLVDKDIVLQVEELSFRYPEYANFKTDILFSGLNLQVISGSISLILAPPDTGKTTLARIFSGLIPRFSGGYISGRVLLNGKDVLKNKPYDLLEDVGIVFQNPDEQILTTSCDTEIAFALESLGVPGKEINRRIDEALEIVDLLKYKKENPYNLSGGEKKRLMIAALLAISPSLYILDETFDEIDTITREKILNFFFESKKTAILFASKWFDVYRRFVTDYYIFDKQGLKRYSREKTENFLKDLRERNVLIDPEKVKLEWIYENSERGTKLPLISVRALEFCYNKTCGQSKSDDYETFRLSVEQFEIHVGEIVAVLGKNGSGKSTFARVLCGVLKPNSGKIMIPDLGSVEKSGERRDIELREALAEELSSYVGYIFQDPDYQIFLPTVYEELALGLKLKGMPKTAIRDVVGKVAEDFLLPPLETPPTLLSFGAKRKLQAATYYLLNRKILILDEMDSGISPVDLLFLLSRLYSKDKALIFITHDFTMARIVAKRIFIFNNGYMKEING